MLLNYFAELASDGRPTIASESRGDNLHNVQVNFVVRSETGRVVLDRSSQAYRWIDLADYRGSGLDDFTISAIAQAVP